MGGWKEAVSVQVAECRVVGYLGQLAVMSSVQEVVLWERDEHGGI